MQGELFNVSGPVVHASQMSKSQSSWMNRFEVTLRFDHLSIVAIFALVLYVLVFSFGVEKGKRFATEELHAKRMKRAQIHYELSQIKQPLISSAEAKVQSQAAVFNPLDGVKKEEPKALIGSEKTGPDALRGKYTIQLVTFDNQSRAQQEVERLKQKGYRSFIIPAGKFHQVCAEGFESVKDAREKLIQLQAEGFGRADAYIRPFKTQVSL